MRHELEFPIKNHIDRMAVNYLYLAWKNGWLDEYSEEHFLIKAINNRLKDFVGKDQLIENNINLLNIVNEDGMIKESLFNLNFCINLSQKLQFLDGMFGGNYIRDFLKGQFAAGKNNYDEDSFFEALSEVSVLAFFAPRYKWKQAIYEPLVTGGSNNKNPEATLIAFCEYKLYGKSVEGEIKINVEVKSPRFPHDKHKNEKIVIPGILLTNEGRSLLKEFCAHKGIKYLDPRVSKLKDFLNSAASKFSIPKYNEINLLYINWSYRDFPANSFLEAWSLLINEYNGILRYPKIAYSIGINAEVFEKITAVIVYTESLEGLMFSDFRYVWQRGRAGSRFRMWILDEKLQKSEKEDTSNIIFRATWMNPSDTKYCFGLMDYNIFTDEERIEAKAVAKQIETIVIDNHL